MRIAGDLPDELLELAQHLARLKDVTLDLVIAEGISHCFVAEFSRDTEPFPVTERRRIIQHRREPQGGQ